MLSQDELTNYAYVVASRYEAINTRYIQKMAQQINLIGHLSASNLNRLEQMAKAGGNIAEINRLLAIETGITLNELKQVYALSANSIYQDVTDLYIANGLTQTPFLANEGLQAYLKSMENLTAGTFSNMSLTSSVQKTYMSAVDKAIQAVTSGGSSYEEVIGQIIDQAGSGIVVTYSSGLTRRLDSAVRMNVLEGMRQVNNYTRAVAGEEFGADGVEISAHALCANDHIDVQGRQYAKGEAPVKIKGKTYKGFDSLELKRQISTCNCKHIIFPILLGISTPTYSDEELKRFKDNSQEKVMVDGKEITRYEATQRMRNIETAIRYKKDEYIMASGIEDSDVAKAKMQEAKDDIKRLQAKYTEITKSAGLTPRQERTYVPGFKGGSNPAPAPIKPKDIT